MSENPLSDFLNSVKGLKKGPKPDDPGSKTPCSKCVGRVNGCMVMTERIPSEECGAFAEIGKNVIKFSDGSERIF